MGIQLSVAILEDCTWHTSAKEIQVVSKSAEEHPHAGKMIPGGALPSKTDSINNTQVLPHKLPGQTRVANSAVHSAYVTHARMVLDTWELFY